MCGIFGVAFRCQSRRRTVQQLLAALRALEYRGYDSAGLAVQFGADVALHVRKCAGRVQALCDLVERDDDNGGDDGPRGRGVGIAHTRWATHGGATDANAHPHTDDAHTFAVVHNGIITNHADLRALLEQHGHVFRSETDTEVVAMLCAYVAEREPALDLARIVRRVCERLEGAYALLVVSSRAPYELVAVRRGSPLIVGLPKGGNGGDWLPTRRLSEIPSSPSASPSPSPGNSVGGGSGAAGSSATTDNNYYFASDAAALAPHVERVLYLDDDTIAHVRSSGTLALYEHDERRAPVCALDVRLEQIGKHGYDDFMLKEIMEQPDTGRQTLAGRLAADGGALHLGGLSAHWRYIRKARRLLFFGCGTSHHAALVAQPVFERFAARPVHVELASDFLDRRPPVYRDDVCVFVSQSGETADTLAVLRYCRDEGDALCVGLVNTVGSNIARATDCGLYLNCGTEIGVASTKAYTSQIVALLMMAVQFGCGDGSMAASENAASGDAAALRHALALLPEQLRDTLRACRDGARRVAQRLDAEGCNRLLLIGRGQQYATCREGALKIKEIAYVHTEAIAAGELKHGSLALVDADAHMLVVATHDDDEGKVHNSLAQLMARRGRPIVITDDETLLDGSVAGGVVDGAGVGDGEQATQCRDRIVVPRAANPMLQCLINILPMQLIAYDLAKLRGHDVDCPRNLAKSVCTQ